MLVWREVRVIPYCLWINEEKKLKQREHEIISFQTLSVCLCIGVYVYSILSIDSNNELWVVYGCEAKPTTLKRPSPSDGFENHMHFPWPWNGLNCNSHVQHTHIISIHFALLILASWLVVDCGFSRVQPAALATHAFKKIPLHLWFWHSWV